MWQVSLLQFLFARVDDEKWPIFMWQPYLLKSWRVSFYVANKNCDIQLPHKNCSCGRGLTLPLLTIVYISIPFFTHNVCGLITPPYLAISCTKLTSLKTILNARKQWQLIKQTMNSVRHGKSTPFEAKSSYSVVWHSKACCVKSSCRTKFSPSCYCLS